MKPGLNKAAAAFLSAAAFKVFCFYLIILSPIFKHLFRILSF